MIRRTWAGAVRCRRIYARTAGRHLCHERRWWCGMSKDHTDQPLVCERSERELTCPAVWGTRERRGLVATTATKPAAVTTKPRAAIGEKTLRPDRWWLTPALVVAGLTAWLAYGGIRAFMQRWYWVEEYHYLTPFHSPCTSTGCEPAAAHFAQVTPDHPLLPF